jgi:serine-type D-Ala-D-Ala carboxypeptidase/endopeptidase (penicillin-binding protein 4)
MDRLKVQPVIFSKLNPLLDNRINKLILIYIIILFQFNLFPQSEIRNQQSAINNLVSGIEKIINDPFFDKTLIALDIFDLTDSISLYQKNNKLLLRPASNMKLLTSAAALINLGEYYTFRTDLYHTGVIEGDTLFGDVFVVGGFDPIFSSEDLDSLVVVIKSLGIKNISGGIYADISKKDSMYWGKGWMWDDDPEPSAPYLSALNINGNSIQVYVDGAEIDSPAIVKLKPETKFLDVVNNSVTVASDDAADILITRDWVNKKNTILVSGKVIKIKNYEHYSKVNLLYPERYFLTVFKEKLEEQEISIEKQNDVKSLADNSVYLTSIYTSIDTVLSVVNKDSDNLSAEMLIYSMAYNDSGAPSVAEDGLVALKRLIDSLGFNSGDYSIADGSGVSHYNLVSAELILETLKYFYYERKDLFPFFYNSMAIAGVDGTLKNRMKGTSAQNNVHAKTGTLNGVSNLSGYVTAKNGHLLAFSIMIQNYVDESSKARSFQNKICELLAEYE